MQRRVKRDVCHVQRKNSMELISNCCSASIYEDHDICSECKEHCGAIDVDSEDEDEYEFINNKWEKQ